MNQKEKDKITIVLLSAVLTITFALIISLIADFNLTRNLVMGWILTTLYAVFVIMLYGTDIRREIIERKVYVDRPVEIEKIKEVIKEVPIQIPVENKTIEVIEKPVFRDIVREVPVRFEVEKPRKRLNIPKYNFVASKITRRYHKRNCRLGKLIKKKYKIHSNSKAFFKRKKYKACKMCIKRK